MRVKGVAANMLAAWLLCHAHGAFAQHYTAGSRVGTEHGVTMLSSNVRLSTGGENQSHDWIPVALPSFLPEETIILRVGVAIRVNETQVTVFAAPDTDVSQGTMIATSSAWGGSDDYRSYTVATVPIHPGSGEFYVRAVNDGGTHARYDMYLVGYEATTAEDHMHYTASVNDSDLDGHHAGTGGGTGCSGQCGADTSTGTPHDDTQRDDRAQE